MSAKRTPNNNKNTLHSKQILYNEVNGSQSTTTFLQVGIQMDKALYCTIGKVTMEKLTSIRSKMNDDTATADDRQLAVFLQEIEALAKNRLSVAANENEFRNGMPVWVERTADSHFPHIRLHGGAHEDDPLRS
jgi:hypothetical protein